METLSKVFEDKYNKNVKDCTNEEIYHGLLSWTKEQLKGRGYQEGKKKIYYISAELRWNPGSRLPDVQDRRFQEMAPARSPRSWKVLCRSL